jgi:hypothetical protein
MTEPSEISDLTRQIKELVEKIDVPKRKDWWDKLSVITTFAGTVILAGISLYVTQSFQKLEAQRQLEFQRSQMEIQRAQVRVEELKAITALAPLLADGDTYETGRQLLQAVRATGALDARPEPAEKSSANKAISLLDEFAHIALSPGASETARIEATQKIGEIAVAPSTSPAVREQAAGVVARIAASDDTPPSVREAAADAIAKIKLVTTPEAERLITSEQVSRKITEVILHHSASPAGSFKGEQTILAIAELQANNFNWNRVSWHFAVGPDGSIWLGAPLNEPAIHTRGHNPASVSVLLIMDGDKEDPTDLQRSSLMAVLRALFTRFDFEATSHAPEGRGFHFHRDYDARKSCPGTRLSKDMVLSW